MSEPTPMQNLNLYRPRQSQHDGRPSVRLLLVAGVALLGLMLLDGGWQFWRLHQTQQGVARALQAAEQAEAELAVRQSEFREPQPDPRLPRQLLELEAGNRQLQQLAGHLQALLAEHSAGFGAPLDALAERHLAGVWLSAIRMEKGGHELLLEGASQSPELLPDYLASLGRSPVFAGRQFARFDLDRDAAGILHFRLSSQAGADPEGSR